MLSDNLLQLDYNQVDHLASSLSACEVVTVLRGKGNVSSVKTRGGTLICRVPAASSFYIKAVQCSNSIFLSDQPSLQQQQRHGVKSPFTLY